MKVLEFQTYVKNGIIKILDNYPLYNNRKVKVIMLLQEEVSSDKDELLDAFREIQKLDVFSEIKDTVEWQKQLRNEWE